MQIVGFPMGRLILWISKLQCPLESTGFAEVWFNPRSVDFMLFFPKLKQRLIDNFIVNARECLNKSSSMSMYRELKSDFDRSPYLVMSQNKK